MSNNPDTWSDYQTALNATTKFEYTGIGYMFSKDDDIVGVDIDHCYNPETKQFNDIARAIIERQPTYVEFSPSGDGVHLYFKGTKPKGSSKNSEKGVEMYDSVRYFTVTGRQLPGSPDTIAEGTDTLKWIYETYIKKPRKTKSSKKKSGEPVELTDEELLDKAKAPRTANSLLHSLRADGRNTIKVNLRRICLFVESSLFGRERTESRWIEYSEALHFIARNGTSVIMRTVRPTEKKRSTKLSNLPTACIHRIQKSRYTSTWADTGGQRVRIHIR